MMRNQLILGDSRDVLPRLPGESVDLVVTDPPYNIASGRALTRHRGRVVSTSEAWGQWDEYTDPEYRALLGWLFAECHRLLRAGGQMYVWLGARWVSEAMHLAELAGFRYRAKLVAVKARVLPCVRRDNWTSAYEEALYLSKGRPRPFHFREQTNALLLPVERKRSSHPTEKRPAMLSPLIEASSDAGDVVLDPFAGSGSTGVVAQALDRRYVLVERDVRYWRMARERLREAA